MKRLIEVLTAFALAGFTFAVCALGWFVIQERPKVDYTLDNVNRLVRETAQTSANVRHATAEWEKASKAQAQYATEASAEAKKSLDDLDTLVRKTDLQLNELVLPQIGRAIEANSAQLLELEKTSTATFVKLGNDSDTLTQQASSVMTAAAQDLADPNIKATLQNLKDTSDATETASEEIAKSLTDVRQIADKARETYLKPVNLWWSLVKQFAGFGGSVAQMAK